MILLISNIKFTLVWQFFVQQLSDIILSIFFSHITYLLKQKILYLHSKEEKDQLIQLSLGKLILILKISTLVN